MEAIKPKSQILLKILVDRFHPGAAREILGKSLHADVAKSISEIHLPHGNLQKLLVHSEEALAAIHYSWIAEAVMLFPKKLYASLIKALPLEQRQGVSALLKVDVPKAPLCPVSKKFLSDSLYKKIEGASDALPLDFIQEKPLFVLLHTDKKKMPELFDFLGLFDLAYKFKLIIDKKTISLVEKALSPGRMKFLRSLLHLKNLVPVADIDLMNWSGDPETLCKLIHRNGILRMTKAVAGYDKDFIWHLSRRLDTGRGRIVLRYFSEEESTITPVLAEQVLLIINTLTRKKES